MTTENLQFQTLEQANFVLKHLLEELDIRQIDALSTSRKHSIEVGPDSGKCNFYRGMALSAEDIMGSIIRYIEVSK